MILYFKNFVFHDRINVTVRRGTKWESLVGHSTVACETGKTEFIGVDIVDAVIIRFCDIKQDQMDLEHDPECHTYRGLLTAMRSAYVKFDEQEIVTVLYFEVLK